MTHKAPLDSKKFLALVFCMAIITGILITALASQPITWPLALFMTVGMLSLGCLAIGYVLSQSALDRFLSTVGDISKSIGVKERKDENASE